MSDTGDHKLTEMFQSLYGHFGPQNWWPGETHLEIMVGAVLTQNTNWRNVEKAIQNLRNESLLSVESLRDVPLAVLAEKIRPAGYYNVKAKRLKNLIHFLVEKYDADIFRLLAAETSELRRDLLEVRGIGPETADSILLYAAHRPLFVVDTYTHRVLTRHGMIEEETTYYELQAFFMENLPDDPPLFNEFHALIVRVGKEYCRKKPRCNDCPLRDWGEISPGITSADSS
ncbi:endonuclease III domain-containing protein [Thermodesulfobacteriota bacterium]